MSGSATPAVGGGSDLTEILRDFVDVTQRLQATHDSLQREVERLRDELEHKNRELERSQRLATLGEMAAGVAHEVRNPLGAIQLYSGLLRSQCNPSDAALGLLEKIDAGIRAIEGVVADTLALVPRGGQLAPLSVSHLLERARESCEATLQRLGVVVAVDPFDDQLAVPADERALPRVLINLISNAAEAAPGRPVGVRVGRAASGRIRIHVTDQGPGVPKELLERIFDPFFTTKPRGTGLGLAIAHRLVDAHGGTLSVRNRSEGGAEFTIELPSATPAADGADSQRQPWFAA
jgi:signal transduction histidine kinase